MSGHPGAQEVERGCRATAPLLLPLGAFPQANHAYSLLAESSLQGKNWSEPETELRWTSEKCLVSGLEWEGG